MPRRKARADTIEDVSAPELYASNVAFFARSAEVVSISFASQRWDSETQSTKRVIVGRLVMPVSGAQEFSERLADYLNRQGLDLSTTARDTRQLQ